eukprot:jgi/Psemu1/323146/estExt_fgenesh1_pg.C_580028
MRHNAHAHAHAEASSPQRGRRLSCLLFLVAILVVPMALHVFWMEPPPITVVSRHDSARKPEEGRNRIDGDDSLTTRYGKEDAFTTLQHRNAMVREPEQPTITTARGDNNDHRLQDASHNNNSNSNNRTPFSSLHDAIRHRESKRRSIQAFVTTAVVLAVPCMVFLYAFLFRRNPDRTTGSKQQRRRDRILKGLNDCRIRVPEQDTTSTSTSTSDRTECPICLERLAPGEWAVASRHCRCGTAVVAACAATPEHTVGARARVRARTVFHEDCIAAWLSQRQTNPQKLCPCCRQPFLARRHRNRNHFDDASDAARHDTATRTSAAGMVGEPPPLVPHTVPDEYGQEFAQDQGNTIEGNDDEDAGQEPGGDQEGDMEPQENDRIDQAARLFANTSCVT